MGLDILVKHVSEFTFISRYHSIDYLAPPEPLLVRQCVQRLGHLSLLPQFKIVAQAYSTVLLVQELAELASRGDIRWLRKPILVEIWR